MKEQQLEELLLQSLEHEKGGIEIYEAALECALNAELRQEWQRYLEQTRNHVRALREVCTALGLDPDWQSRGRAVVRKLGASLVAAMSDALATGSPEAAQLVACECVVLAETKDHLHWELIGRCAAKLRGITGSALSEAYERFEEQEDEHLYHSKGWCRELWIESLGMKAILPPFEERENAKAVLGAARAEQASSR
jgi:hypothetical protein